MKNYIVPKPPPTVPVAEWKRASPPSPPRSCLKLGPIPVVQPTLAATSPSHQNQWMASSSTTSTSIVPTTPMSTTSIAPETSTPEVSHETTETETSPATDITSTPATTSTSSTTPVSVTAITDATQNPDGSSTTPRISETIEGFVDCTGKQYYRDRVDCRKVNHCL